MCRVATFAAKGTGSSFGAWKQTVGACAVRRMSSIGAGKSSRLPKFHTLDVSARIDALEKAGFLTSETRAALEGRGLALEDANNMVENVLATFGVPMV